MLLNEDSLFRSRFFRMAVVVIFALAGSAVAAEEAVSDPDAVSVLGRGVLGRSSLLIRGKVVRSGAMGFGVEVGTLEVLETLRGTAPAGGRIQVLTSEKDYFRRLPGEALFFVKPLRGGERFEPVAVMDLADGTGDVRLAAVRRVLTVEALPVAARAAAMRLVVLESLDAGDVWTRSNGARELAHLTSVAPGCFTPEDRRALARRAAGAEETALRPFLIEAADRLRAAEERGVLAPDTAPRTSALAAALQRQVREDPDPVRRCEAVESLTASGGTAEADLLASVLEKDSAATVRAKVASALSRLPLTESSSRALTAAASQDGDATLRALAIESLGFLKVEAAVPLLERRARSSGDDLSLCLYALARIGSPAAKAALDALHGAANGSGERPRKTRLLIEFLRSKEFTEQETLLRRLR
jgi:hypothetical protein